MLLVDLVAVRMRPKETFLWREANHANDSHGPSSKRAKVANGNLHVLAH